MILETHDNIIVAGTHGARLLEILELLVELGWQITWPGQDVNIQDGLILAQHNNQNIEVQLIHQAVCDSFGGSLLSTHLPDHYATPYPGPAEFLAKFSRPAAISGASIAPFLDVWAGYAKAVIDVRATAEDDLAALHYWTRNSYADKYLLAIREHHLKRYGRCLKLFPKVFTMTNSEAKDRRFDGLNQFLKYVF